MNNSSKEIQTIAVLCHQQPQCLPLCSKAILSSIDYDIDSVYLLIYFVRVCVCSFFLPLCVCDTERERESMSSGIPALCIYFTRNSTVIVILSHLHKNIHRCHRNVMCKSCYDFEEKDSLLNGNLFSSFFFSKKREELNSKEHTHSEWHSIFMSIIQSIWMTNFRLKNVDPNQILLIKINWSRLFLFLICSFIYLFFFQSNEFLINSFALICHFEQFFILISFNFSYFFLNAKRLMREKEIVLSSILNFISLKITRQKET